MDALVARASALVAPPKGILATGPGGAALSGLPLPEAIGAAGLMTGVRANTGRHPLPGTRGETITEGLDGLPARLDGWARRGAVFATWRAVLRIGPGTPSPVAVRANAQALGRYAAACQAAGLVPLVAPHLDVGGLRSPAWPSRETASAPSGPPRSWPQCSPCRISGR